MTNGVGFIDLEVTPGDLSWTDGIFLARGGVPIKGLSARFYYPSTPSPTPPKHNPWLPENGSKQYSIGAGNFLFFHAPGKDRPLMKFLRYIVERAHFRAGMSTKFEGEFAAQPAPLSSAGPLPLVIFSHGIGGHRTAYSVPCMELVKAGYGVLAIEHSDGSAMCCKLAGTPTFLHYQGLGGIKGMHFKIDYRVQEVKIAIRALQDLLDMRASSSLSTVTNPVGGEGADTDLGQVGSDPCLRVRVTGGGRAREMAAKLRGRFDCSRVSVAGHSFGGATAIAAGSILEEVRCIIALDPYYPAIPYDYPCREHWVSRAPLLVIGSESWNTPDPRGRIYAEGDEIGLQNQILRACAATSAPAARKAAEDATKRLQRETREGHLHARVAEERLGSQLPETDEVSHALHEARSPTSPLKAGRARWSRQRSKEEKEERRRRLDPEYTPRPLVVEMGQLPAATAQAGGTEGEGEGMVEGVEPPGSVGDGDGEGDGAWGEEGPASLSSLSQPRGPGCIFLIPRGSSHQNFDDTLVRWADKQPFKFLLKLLKFETALEPHAGMRMITQGMVTFLDQVNRPAGALAYLWRDAEAAKGAGPAPSPPSRASLSLDRSDRPEGPVGPVDVHVHAVSRSSISSQLTVSVRGGASVGGHAYKGEVQGLPEAFARVRKCFEGHVLEAFAA